MRDEDARPLQERCGLTAAELADWHHVSAELGRQMAVAAVRRARSRAVLAWVPLIFLALLVSAMLIGATA